MADATLPTTLPDSPPPCAVLPSADRGRRVSVSTKGVDDGEEREESAVDEGELRGLPFGDSADVCDCDCVWDEDEDDAESDPEGGDVDVEGKGPKWISGSRPSTSSAYAWNIFLCRDVRDLSLALAWSSVATSTGTIGFTEIEAHLGICTLHATTRSPRSAFDPLA